MPKMENRYRFKYQSQRRKGTRDDGVSRELIKLLMGHYQLRWADLGKALGVGYDAVRRKMLGERSFNTVDVIRLSHLFHVPAGVFLPAGYHDDDGLEKVRPELKKMIEEHRAET